MNRRFSTGGTTPALKSYADHRKIQMTSTPKAEMSINSRTSSNRHESFDFPSIIDKRNSSRLYKVIVIGEVSTGKSALIKRYVHNFFGDHDNYRATVGVDFQLKILKFNDDLGIRLQLWDIAGQERFSSMTRAYYKGAVGAVVVFDQSDARTFHAAMARWKPDLDSKIATTEDDRKLPVVLVCNKSDLERDPNLPDDFEISKLVQEQGFVPKWIKTSAKTGDGVSDAFNLIVRYIMTMDSWSDPLLDPDSDSLELSSCSYDLNSTFDRTRSGSDQRRSSKSNLDTVDLSKSFKHQPKSYCMSCFFH